MIDLAENQDGGAVSTQSIAQRQDISESYLEQLIRMLKKSGLVTSVRGAGGGYRLAGSASEISVGDVLRSLEGSLEAVECPAIVGDDCSGADECVTKIVWKRINDAIAQAVDSVMISELVAESVKLKSAKKSRTEKERTETAINARIIREEQCKSVREAQK
jgi:Rrf2 family protein